MIGIALIEQNGERAMPLGGKALKEPIRKGSEPKNHFKSIALELLVRIIQKSNESALKAFAQDKSLLLVEMPMLSMQEKLPSIKAEWIKTGNNENFMSSIKDFSNRIWSIDFVKYEGVIFNEL